jgi:hypothetical protein
MKRSTVLSLSLKLMFLAGLHREIPFTILPFFWLVNIFVRKAEAGNTQLRGRISTVYLLVLTSLDQRLWIPKQNFSFF